MIHSRIRMSNRIRKLHSRNSGVIRQVGSVGTSRLQGTNLGQLPRGRPYANNQRCAGRSGVRRFLKPRVRLGRRGLRTAEYGELRDRSLLMYRNECPGESPLVSPRLDWREAATRCADWRGSVIRAAIHGKSGAPPRCHAPRPRSAGPSANLLPHRSIGAPDRHRTTRWFFGCRG